MKFRRLIAVWYLVIRLLATLHAVTLRVLNRPNNGVFDYKLKRMFGMIDKHSEPKRCFKCASTDFRETVTDRIEGAITEKKSNCRKCGTENGYWAYGLWIK